MKKTQPITDTNLLHVLIELNQWEDSQCPELQTVSGRDLYYKVAASMLVNDSDKTQPLKLLSGRVTDRATRIRIREFQALGLVTVVESENDARTRRVVPTALFASRLNEHVSWFKRLCNQRFLMLDRG
jgi:hypothetical protein